MGSIDHAPDGYPRRALIQKAPVCEHGISGKCWWCEQLESKSVKEQIKILEERGEALYDLVRKVVLPAAMRGGGYFGEVPQPMKKLIDSGPDAGKPSGGDNLAFYYATDVDKIYQYRDTSWIDISFSRPTGGDHRITNIDVDAATGTIEADTV